MSLAQFLERLGRGLFLVRERIPQILSEPRAHSREAMILALIAALGLVLVVLAAVAVASAISGARARRRMRVRARPKVVARRVVLVTASVLVAGAAVAMVPLVPAAGQACGACHAVRADVDAWRSDAHRDVGCYACHARRGVFGALEAGALGATAFVGAEVRVSPGGESCLECHQGVREDTLARDGIRVRHEDIIRAGIGCLLCHPSVGHTEPSAESTSGPSVEVGPPDSDEAAFARPVMSRCLRCHDGKTAPADCGVCHVDKNPSDTASASSPRGDTPADVRCSGCHRQATQERCIRCHGLELPHPEQFGRGHAAVSFGAPGLCARCHEGAVADPADACACHTEVNTHGTYSQWFPVHGPAATSSGPGGCRCHDTGFCASCHSDDPLRR